MVVVGLVMVISLGLSKTESINATDLLHSTFKKGMVDDSILWGSTKNSLTLTRGLLVKSPLETKRTLAKSGRHSIVGGGFILMKTPRVLMSHCRDGGDEYNNGDVGEGEMEFLSVKGKLRSSLTMSLGHWVV